MALFTRVFEKINSNRVNLAVWDERIRLTDVDFLFKLLLNQVKVDFESYGVSEFNAGEKLFYDCGSKTEESKVVKYIGTEELITEHGRKHRLLKLEVKSNGNLTYRLDLRKNNWKIRPADCDELLTPTKLSLDDVPPYLTPSKILAKELEIPSSKINRIKRTSIILITAQSRSVYIENLRGFSYKGYGFLDYFPARYWDGLNYRSIAVKKNQRRSTGKTIINFLPSIDELFQWLESKYFNLDENYIILSDKYLEVLKPSNLLKLKKSLSDNSNLGMIYFGDAASVKGLIDNVRSDRRICEYFFFDSIMIEDDNSWVEKLTMQNNLLTNPLNEHYDQLMQIALDTYSESLRNSIRVLSHELLNVFPKTDIINSKLEDLICMQQNANIPNELLQSIESLDLDQNPKKVTFQQLLNGRRTVANIRHVQFDQLINFRDIYKMLKERKSIKDLSFFVLNVYDLQWILPLIFTRAISIDQIYVLIYEKEFDRWHFRIKRSLEVLQKIGFNAKMQEESPHTVQDKTIKFWETFDLAFSSYSIGTGNEYVNARILRLSSDGEEYVLAVPAEESNVFVMGEEGLSIKKQIDDLEFYDKIIHFSGNRNVIQEFNDFLDSSVQSMAAKSKKWKSHLERYLEKHSLSMLTRKLNNLGWNISENGVRAWLNEERIGTMRPYYHFPLIAEAIDDEEFKKNAQEYAEASAFLQSASKKLGRWLIKVSRAILSNQNVDDIIKQYPKEIQNKLLQIAKNYKIYEFEEIIEGIHEVKNSELNIIRRVS